MILMELELSRMAFFCDMHSQWCALPSLATWSQLPLRLCLCTRAWRRFWERRLNIKLRSFPFPLPFPLPLTSPFCVVSAESQSVSWMFENRAQNAASHSWVGIWKSLSQGCFAWVFFFFFFSLTLKKSTTKVVGEIGFKAVHSFPYGKYQGLSHWNM